MNKEDLEFTKSKSGEKNAEKSFTTQETKSCYFDKSRSSYPSDKKGFTGMTPEMRGQVF